MRDVYMKCKRKKPVSFDIKNLYHFLSTLDTIVSLCESHRLGNLAPFFVYCSPRPGPCKNSQYHIITLLGNLNNHQFFLVNPDFNIFVHILCSCQLTSFLEESTAMVANTIPSIIAEVDTKGTRRRAISWKNDTSKPSTRATQTIVARSSRTWRE